MLRIFRKKERRKMKIILNKDGYINLPAGYRLLKTKDGTVIADMAGFQKITDESNCIASITIAKNPMNLDDTKKLIQGIHDALDENQGLIEAANGENASGYKYIYSIVKTLRKAEGVLYFLRMNLEVKGTIYEIDASFEEYGNTGMRDALVWSYVLNSGIAGNEEDLKSKWCRDPYDGEFDYGIPMNMSEDRSFDSFFPEHPLTQAREFVETILQANESRLEKTVKVELVPEEFLCEEAIEESAKEKIKAFADKIKEKSPELKQAAAEKTIRLKDAASDAGDKMSDALEKLKTKRDEHKNREENRIDEDHKKIKTGMLKANLRKEAVEEFNKSLEVYNDVADKLNTECENLYEKREEALKTIMVVQEHINRIANKPKEFETELQKIEIEVKDFNDKKAEIQKAEKEAKMAAGGSGAGATLSALGVAVATMGPTAAMGVATTFGVASTGTAISALSGAAAQSAALAWLGGGALAAGGGGMAAGNAFLALAGPVGWGIAGSMFALSLGAGAFAAHKNAKAAEEAREQRMELEKITRSYELTISEITNIIRMTETQIKGLETADKLVKGDDYSNFSDDEKLQAGLLVNMTLSLAQLVNREVNVNE